MCDSHTMLFTIFSVLSTRWPEAMYLLHKMLDRCEYDTAYKAHFHQWVKEGSTLRLRELVSPFGNYATSINSCVNLGFANKVDALDTARSNAQQVLSLDNESGELNPGYTDAQYGKLYNVRKVALGDNLNVLHWCMSTPL